MAKVPRLMGCAYEGDKNQKPIKSMGLEPVVFSWIGRVGKALGNMNEELYKKRNEAEGLFWRLKGNCLSPLPLGQVGYEIHGLHNVPPHLQPAPL